MLNKLKRWFKKNVALGFTLLFALITLVLWLFSVDEINFSDLWLNLLAGFVATICTITIIDSTLKKQKEKEELPIRLALYRDVQLLTSRVINLWQEMYTQCNPSRNNILIDDLFVKEEIEFIFANLDLEGFPNVIPQRNWFGYIDENAKDFEKRGNLILDRYVSLAEPELLEAIHYMVNNSALCARLSLIQGVKRTDMYDGIPRVPLLQIYMSKPKERDYDNFKRIIKWCRDNYEKLSDYGTVGNISERVVIMNPHVPPESSMTEEKLGKYVKEYRMWQQRQK